MKAVILAGGFGTRISEETGLKPKAGLYLAVCSFNNEAKASISLNVIKLGGADGT